MPARSPHNDATSRPLIRFDFGRNVPVQAGQGTASDPVLTPIAHRISRSHLSEVRGELLPTLDSMLSTKADQVTQRPTAGLSTKERLEAMLDVATFAFLVMTGDDELHDGTKVAREREGILKTR